LRYDDFDWIVNVNCILVAIRAKASDCAQDTVRILRR
jgi:hypothetical protein